MLAEACPITLCKALTFAPACTASEANVCRMSCGDGHIDGSQPRRRSASGHHEWFVGLSVAACWRMGRPFGSVNTRSRGFLSVSSGPSASMTMRGMGTMRCSLLFGVPSTGLPLTCTVLCLIRSTPCRKSTSSTRRPEASPHLSPQKPKVSTSARRTSPNRFALRASSANSMTWLAVRYTRFCLRCGFRGSSMPSHGLWSMSLSRTALRQMAASIPYAPMTTVAERREASSLTQRCTSPWVMPLILRPLHTSTQ